MARVFIAIAPGFEDIEALYPSDILSRGGYSPCHIAIVDPKPVDPKSNVHDHSSPLAVEASHGTVLRCAPFDELKTMGADDVLVLPGGIPGSDNLAQHTELSDIVLAHNQQKGLIGAICAAPARVLAPLGILAHTSCVCHPEFMAELSGHEPTATLVPHASVVMFDNIITSKGIGTAQDFGIALLYQLLKKEYTKENKQEEGQRKAQERVKTLWNSMLQRADFPLEF